MPRSAREGEDSASWGPTEDSSADCRAGTVYGGRKIVAARNRVLFTLSGSVFTKESVYGISCLSLESRVSIGPDIEQRLEVGGTAAIHSNRNRGRQELRRDDKEKAA
ncbi:hypothetical protein JCGZ_10629 [Jatropha curcas]|uniref:Uncharacterized protein n=1 Tax=Jatropha curcas TaxID=180498 RepID=A0A067KU76_JATCU|nr:hypothetical protein JCGZ_10629 [Jatropha curcas]